MESNAARTVSAEMDAIAWHLGGCVAKAPVDLEPELEQPLVDSLLRASGVHVVADSIKEALAWPLGRVLARPEPPARPAVAAAQTTWIRRTARGLPSAWLESVEEAVVSPDQLANQTTEAVGSVPLPVRRAPMVELLWWGGLLLMLSGVAAGALALMRDALSWAYLLAPALGVVLLVVAQNLRLKRARQESAHYLEQTRKRVEAAVERGLSSPAGRVLARHRVLQQTLGR